MNDYDSGVMAGLLEADGWRRVENEEDADLVIVNTCSVRAGAEQRAIGRITNINRIKKHRRPGMILCLAGCIAQQRGEEIAKQFPFIDLVVGTRDFVRLPQLVEEVKSTGNQIIAISNIYNPLELGVPHTIQKYAVRAEVTIIYGCNNFCSYCIVPYVRGREQSRPADEILAEINSLVERGYREIILLGQNVNAYHYNGIDFAELLKKVNSIDRLWRIRFVTSHPKDTTPRLIETIASLDKVCEHLHLPVQSGSNKILERMNRKYTREYYLELIKMARSKIPGVAITTDIIVGFPGETEEDFEQTLELVKEVEFDSAFTFMYTPRPFTKASAQFKDDVPLEIKKERLTKLIELQNQITLKKNKALIGTEQEVLVEKSGRKGGKQLLGRTRSDKIVAFNGEETMIGRLVNVKITEAFPHTLFGELT